MVRCMSRADDRADQALLVERLAHERAAIGDRSQRVWARVEPPEERCAQVHEIPGGHVSDLPDKRRQLRLLDLEALADGEAGSVEGDEAGDRGRPFGPTFDIGEHVPHQRRRGVDLDAALSNHVPDGT